MATSKPSSSSKLSKSPTPPASASSSRPPTMSSASASSSSLSSHLAMVELKSRILSALAKLADRDTHQIAAEDLDRIVRSLPSDGVPMMINALIHDPAAPAPLQDPGAKNPSLVAARRESLRLLALLCSCHADAASAHIPKVIAHIVRRLKDPASDTSVREACRDAAGSLAALYLRPVAAAAAGTNDAVSGSGGGAGTVSSPLLTMFVKPLFEAMGEQNKVVQGGAALCLAKVVECSGAGDREGEEGRAVSGTGVIFQRLCSRICKLLGGQSFLAKAHLLSVVSSLAQVGAISQQNMQQVLQTVRECLESSDWTARKAAADTLGVLTSCSSHLHGDGAAATITALEACRFDKVKPVRDSMMEALMLWKKVTVKGEDGTSADSKDSRNSEATDNEEKLNNKRSNPNRNSESIKDASAGSSPPESSSISKGKGASILEKAAVLLKKKELNPEFFQKLETRSSDDLPVEVVVPRKCVHSSHSHSEDEGEVSYLDSRNTPKKSGAVYRESSDAHNGNNANFQTPDKRSGACNKLQDADEFARDKWTEQRGVRAKESKASTFDVDEGIELSQKDPSPNRLNISRTDATNDGPFMSNKGNWSAIQRQLAQLERQQASLMNMLQEFMGGSHDSMVTLENRVHGLERVVEEMAHDFSLSAGRRCGSMMLGFERSPGRSSSKYNGLHEYSASKFGRGGEGRMPFSERFLSSDGTGIRGRDPPWRSNSEAWDSYGYAASRNVIMNSRRGFTGVSADGRMSRSEYDSDQASGRRAWDKGQGPFRLGEGPSARSVWQASKDEATLEAIRVAGEDNGASRVAARTAVPELDGEVLTNDNAGHEKGPLWASWTRAMDSLHVGDIDSAYAEVLSAGDDFLLVKLMDKSGPVIDQLSNEIASEILRAIGQFILEQSFFDIALTWLQHLTELVMENGPDFLGIPLEWKREILLNLHEASALDLPEDWEGSPPDQLMMHLAKVWGINLQQLIK